MATNRPGRTTPLSRPPDGCVAQRPLRRQEFAQSSPCGQAAADAGPGHPAYGRHVVRFVALGDSLTEGTGDPHPAYPNGLRGWADLLAAHLGRRNPTTEYANLALRAKRAGEVAAEQVDAALALRPDVVTLWVGGNDLLRPVLRLREVLDPIDEAVGRLTASGATVFVLTGLPLPRHRIVAPVRGRVMRLDARVRDLVTAHQGTIVDLADAGGPDLWANPRMWDADRVHPSPMGHAHLAHRLADALGEPMTRPAPRPVRLVPRTAPRRGQRWNQLVDEGQWWCTEAIPHLARWAANASVHEGVLPKWPVPILPAQAFGPVRLAG